MIIYEALEESFPQLRREREIAEELRKAEQAHAYICEHEDDEDGILREYMEAEEASADDDGIAKAPMEPEKPPPAKKVNIRNKNARKQGPATMSDLPTEDIFGFQKPQKKKEFPTDGRRLGDGSMSVSEIFKDLANELPSLEDMMFLLIAVFSLYIVVRAILRSIRGARSTQTPADTKMAKMEERVSLLIQHAEQILLRQNTAQPQFVMLPPSTFATTAAYQQHASQSVSDGNNA